MDGCGHQLRPVVVIGTAPSALRLTHVYVYCLCMICMIALGFPCKHVPNLQVQLAERVSHDANVVQFYGVAVAPHAVLLVMELMPVGH